jgi:hypothetical protein
VEPVFGLQVLPPVSLSGQLTPDLRRVAAERARELWLTGDRQTTARRLRREPALGIDLYPPVKLFVGGGDDIAFPIPYRELETNSRATSACPAGQNPGSWR